LERVKRRPGIFIASSDNYELGLPTNVASRVLLFNATANCLIAYVRLDRLGQPGLLFVRHANQRKYRQIGKPGEEESFVEPIVCQHAPYLFWRKERIHIKDGKVGGFSPTGIAQLDLTNLVPSEKSTEALPGLGELIGASHDAKQIFCTYRLQGPRHRGQYICRIDWNSERITPIMRMRNALY
jgi:hypothetical protein